MRFLSTYPLLTNKPLLPPFHLHLHLHLRPQSSSHIFNSLKTPPSHPKPQPIAATTTTVSLPLSSNLPSFKPPKPPFYSTHSLHLFADWPQFAKRVSGEWDGFVAEFTPSGSPIELPENVVPEAFREWEVQLFDWQTQCPTLAQLENPCLSYKLIKLLPTVGCEADAAIRHSVEERVAGGDGSMVSGFGYNVDGCYVAVWGNGEMGLELEHCLVRKEDGEVRVRVVMEVKVEEEGGLRLERIRVFSESWDGPWRNGELMGGCAIKESGFALSGRVEVGDVVGAWEGRSLGVAKVGRYGKGLLLELCEEEPQKSIRDQVGLASLPKNLWCSLKEKNNGETWGEVGWLIDRGTAITSRCVFLKGGNLKEMAIGQETAVLDVDM